MMDFDTLLVALIELRGLARTDDQWNAADLMLGYCEENQLEIGEFLAQEYADGR